MSADATEDGKAMDEAQSRRLADDWKAIRAKDIYSIIEKIGGGRPARA
jgi:hypothetical protein